MPITPRHKVGDRVWTGSFSRGRHGEIRVSIFQRQVLSVIPNYLDKYGLHYGLISVQKLEDAKRSARQTGEPLRRFGVAYKPHNIFDTEEAARMNVREQIERELCALNMVLVELPTLEPGKIHERNA